ncbi:MAG: glycosyltransferase family 2 protein [Coriobacteriales bacterium]|nr:glycosyltransferase family 2 protein [Coriobacteriales bacterium]
MLESLMRGYVSVFNVFIAVYLIVYTLILLGSTVYGALRILRDERLESLHNVLEHDFYFPVSILIPLHNEGQTGIQTVANVLKHDYKLFEVVIIDDGSTDQTKQLVIDHFALKREYGRPIRYQVPCKPIREVYVGRYEGRDITLICKVNGGSKADAVNAGINASAYPYILNMDGDEILQRDALVRAARAIMEDDNVIGVGGNLRISNSVEFRDAMPQKHAFGKNLLPDVQTLEYGRNFAGSRLLHNQWNANLIISGGYGVFKKSALIEVGGYDRESMGEDFEMTLRLHEHYLSQKEPYRMKYVEDSICWTQAPNTYRDLGKQRERWQCGLMQTLAKYRGMILNPRYGKVGMLMLPYHIAYELLAPTIMVLGWLAIACSLLLGDFNFPFVIMVYMVYVLFSVMLTAISFVGNCHRGGEKLGALTIAKVVGLGLYEAFVYRTYVLAVQFFSQFRRKRTAKTWVSPRRVLIDA